MAADHALRRELCRRIRDDLIALGVVAAGPAVRIADGARASAGDLITCTRNDHQVEAGEPGRTLANGDLLRIEAVTAGGLVVRRALDADPATGQRRWTDRTFLYPHFGDAELGYAVTDHVAQGRTVHTGLAVITGTEDRQQRVAERVQATRFGDLRWSEGTTVRLAGLLGGGTHHTHQKKVARGNRADGRRQPDIRYSCVSRSSITADLPFNGPTEGHPVVAARAHARNVIINDFSL